jgi:hypothetical protein
MIMKLARKSKTRFVPLAVYRTAFAGVVPVCVAACGGSGTTAGSVEAGADGTDDMVLQGVGCAAFACGVAAPAFDAGRDALSTDATGTDGQPDAPVLTVACTGFCGGGFDSGVADAAFGGGDTG